MADNFRTIDYRNLSYKSLFLDYRSHFEKLAPFFAGDPDKPESWTGLASELAKRTYPRQRVASELRRLNQGLSADAPALASIDALEKGALVVVTGQQVGLFGGPLYTLYKALTAVSLARRASSQLDVPVVPVFWMDADDHDFEEVQSTHVLDRENELHRLALDAANAETNVSVGGRRIESSIEDVIEEARRALPDSEFKEDVLGSVSECYRPGATLAEAFGRWLLALTRDSGLVVVDPTRGELKELGAGLFQREIGEASASAGLVADTTRELLARGYHAQITRTDGHLNLFYADPARYHIAVADDGLRYSEDAVLPHDALRRRVEDEPDRFSPNVVLRPLYQDTLFPTLAYVAGPSELAYFGQLRAVYRQFDVPMPLVASRASLTVVERAQARFLERYGVDFVDMRGGDESVLNRILKEQAPPELSESLDRARRWLEDVMVSLERDFARLDQSLVGTARSAKGRILHQLKELESKGLRAIKRKDDTVRKQFLSTRSALFPDFGMQERKLSPLTFYVRHGWHFTQMVADAVDYDRSAHVLLYT